MKHLIKATSVLMFLGFFSCSNKPSEVPSEEYVESVARSAAQAISLADHNDTLALQQAIVEAYAIKSDLILNGDQDNADIFDEAFMNELEKVDPDVAKEVFP